MQQEYGHIVQWIVENGGRYISNTTKEVVLKWVKNPKIAEALSKKFHGQNLRVNSKTAVQFEMHGIVEHFVQNDPNIVNYVDPFEEPYLHLAVRSAVPQMVEFLIRCGFNVNMPDGLGWMALNVAVSKGLIEIVSILVKNGAIINCFDPIGGGKENQV